MHPKLQETFSKYDTIFLVGGGSGGHIQPILNISEELKQKKLIWIGGKNSNEESEAKNAGIAFRSVSTLKLSTTKSPKVLLYPYVLLKGIWEARRILLSVISTEARNERNGEILLNTWKRFLDFGYRLRSKGQIQSTISRANQHTCVFSKGGPGSVAVGIAAWTLGIPLYIHESDTIPGRSNHILAKLATKIFLGFESAKKYFNPKKCETIGQILHPVFSIEHSNPPTFQHSISWKTDKKHILVICGSQGSRAIFEQIISDFRGSNTYEWIIALGKLNESMKHNFDTIMDLQAISWISQEDIAQLIQCADIAITRGSATTLAELTSFRDIHPIHQDSNCPTLQRSNIQLIIVPLPYSADNHQYWNAKEYEKNGDILLEQKNLKQLPEIIKKLGQNSQHSSI